ncbi:MAG: hypothetical protein M1828_007588 [Chrysothrix sp. TS-e1954]|nr:MAG: hypothetical protein M1828_007588 [Chrysothrix sp. TS-e1954]
MPRLSASEFDGSDRQKKGEDDTALEKPVASGPNDLDYAAERHELENHVESQRQDAPATPYSLFTPRDKKILTVILILTMLASPLTATIYLPLLPLLAEQFHVSGQAVNLTITIYIVFQAISPLLFATMSDTVGRRPIYLTTYALYTLSSLGLALNQHNYAALLILRALQSLGASAVLAVAFGVVADVCPPAERGAMLGPTQSAANLAVCLGPVIGGWVALGSHGFVWVFWALVIFGGTVFILIGIALPETARSLVGNGNRRVRPWRRTWFKILGDSGARTQKQSKDDTRFAEHTNEAGNEKAGGDAGRISQMGKRQFFKKVNPWGAIRIVFYKDTALVLWLAGAPYATWYCIQASISQIYKDVYKFNELQIGLSYLTGGFGTVLGGYANGKLMDWNYRSTARSIGYTINKVSGDDLRKFPIERARAKGAFGLLVIYTGALAGYGWSIRTHESLPLILQFVLAALCTSFQQTFNALLVDIFPASPSTAAASSNITRCTLAAVAVAILQPLVGAIGRGWFFTLLALVSGGGGFFANLALVNHGMQWREARLAKGEAKIQGLAEGRSKEMESQRSNTGQVQGT